MAYRFQVPPKPLASTVATHSLLAQVLGITGLGLCITAWAAYAFNGSISFGVGLIAMLIGFGLLFAINAVRANEALALGLFYLFTFLEGIGLAPTIHNYLQAVGSGPIISAALTTGVGMFGLGAIVYMTGLDLRRFSGWFFGALMALVLVGVVSMFVHFIPPSIYSYGVLIIFSGLVLIDFARIRAGGDGLNPVQMSVQIYLDAINIFLALLQIFGGRSRD